MILWLWQTILLGYRIYNPVMQYVSKNLLFSVKTTFRKLYVVPPRKGKFGTGRSASGCLDVFAECWSLARKQKKNSLIFESLQGFGEHAQCAPLSAPKATRPPVQRRSHTEHRLRVSAVDLQLAVRTEEHWLFITAIHSPRKVALTWHRSSSGFIFIKGISRKQTFEAGTLKHLFPLASLAFWPSPEG